MNEVRCKGCFKLLGKFTGAGEIICPICGGKNTFDTDSEKIIFSAKKIRHPTSLKDRPTSSGVVFRD